jgi:23S rRNA (cytidine1920-2'-O)/16S rRNA (cytidine1409-2'-O)-methyltransferase
MKTVEGNYVSRGALKLKAALEEFKVDMEGKVAADFGSSTGGFTEVLLEAGATKVYSVDTAYGQLAWKLRTNERVVAMERTNALHVVLPEKVDCIVIDAGWTPQKMILRSAFENLAEGGSIITLVKPHYEAGGYGLKKRTGILDEAESEEILKRVVEDLEKIYNLKIIHSMKSPITGGKGGNSEYLLLIERG